MLKNDLVAVYSLLKQINSNFYSSQKRSQENRKVPVPENPITQEYHLEQPH
uniref:Uncharacterized protein n=1 Tax=Anguilla anguilla TaxID=7936 RepID=A0A0E9PXM0_ANGAN